MARLPSGTVTLLFSDIEGSTRLLGRLGALYEGVLAEHRQLLRTAFAGSGGVEVETRGDSFLIAFRSALEAVQGAIAAQRALAVYAWPEGVVVRVRMGIHTGEPHVTSEGYVGLDVHRAARIGEAAHGGQMVVSESTRALMGASLPLRDLGEYRLEGLAEPERIYQIVVPGLPTDFGALRAEPPSRRRRNRASKPVDLARAGWRVQGLLGVAPAALARPIEALSGSVLAAARIVADADRTLAICDRDELASRLADYRARSSAAPHVAQAADELAAQLAALDRLPERRRAVEGEIVRLDDDVEVLESRLRSLPPHGDTGALSGELEYLRDRLAEATRLLEQVQTAAPSVPQVDLGALRRTRRRGIFRVGDSYVVLVADEHGVKRPQIARTLNDALELREYTAAARRRAGDPHDHRDPYFPWDNPGF
jgi:class 3 adenylate cyclase